MNNLEETFEPIEKALRAEVTREQLYMLVNHLHEAIESLIDDEMEDDMEGESEDSTEMEGMPEMESANPAPIVDPNKNDVNWPVAKTEGQLIINEKEKEIMDQSKPETVKKSVWTGSLDPITFTKRKFTTAQRKEEAAAGHAMPDGSYPISNKKDLENAIRSWGRGGAKADVKAHIKRRAKALGAEDMIPENWK
jgi:hypothetical protein